MKYDKQLGMDVGTAHHKLRQLITLNLLQQLKQDICYKCGNKISNISELSIEHKIPWRNNSNELFWDLNNIAFSHKKCNRPHKHGSNGLKGKIKGCGSVTSYNRGCRCMECKKVKYISIGKYKG